MQIEIERLENNGWDTGNDIQLHILWSFIQGSKNLISCFFIILGSERSRYEKASDPKSISTDEWAAVPRFHVWYSTEAVMKMCTIKTKHGKAIRGITGSSVGEDILEKEEL